MRGEKTTAKMLEKQVRLSETEDPSTYVAETDDRAGNGCVVALAIVAGIIVLLALAATGEGSDPVATPAGMVYYALLLW